MGVQKDPVVLNVPNHLVYEPHAYIRQNDFEKLRQAISTATTLFPVGGQIWWDQGGDDKWNWYKDFVTYLENSKTQSSVPGGTGDQSGYFGLTPKQ